jgi:hypothetical protein
MADVIKRIGASQFEEVTDVMHSNNRPQMTKDLGTAIVEPAACPGRWDKMESVVCFYIYAGKMSVTVI